MFHYFFPFHPVFLTQNYLPSFLISIPFNLIRNPCIFCHLFIGVESLLPSAHVFLNESNLLEHFDRLTHSSLSEAQRILKSSKTCIVFLFASKRNTQLEDRLKQGQLACRRLDFPFLNCFLKIFRRISEHAFPEINPANIMVSVGKINLFILALVVDCQGLRVIFETKLKFLKLQINGAKVTFSHRPMLQIILR